MATHYETLGVKSDIGQDALRTAYRALAKRWHPDICKESGAEAKFKEVSLAYEVLSNIQTRAQYDMILRRPAAAENSLVSTVFNDFLRPVPKKRKRGKKHPKAQVEIDLIPDYSMDDDETAGGIF